MLSHRCAACFLHQTFQIRCQNYACFATEARGGLETVLARWWAWSWQWPQAFWLQVLDFSVPDGSSENAQGILDSVSQSVEWS